jgi:chemotaxis protein histidine kinase CheA
LGGDKVSLVPEKSDDAGPRANPQDAVRKDYELALQLGTRDAWNAFLVQYPDGFYANLARGQLSKIAAEQARAATEERARVAEQEKVRLTAEGAKTAQQAKAAAEVKAAEAARIAAEKAKQVEQAKAEAAEQERKAAEAAAAKAQADKEAAEKAAVELTIRQTSENRAAVEADNKMAALSPAPSSAVSRLDLAKSLQAELRRVGCLAADADGNWNAAAQHSLTLFNKYAGTKFDVKLASPDVLDAIKAKPGRVCPLVCDRGFRADGDACVKIACLKGYRVNDDNECEKIQEKKPVATRDDAAKRDAERKKVESAPPSKSQASGAIFCNQGGCRPVRSGCRLETTNAQAVGMSSGRLVEVCN